LVALLVWASSLGGEARAVVLDLGPVDAILDITLAYGLMVRTQDQDPDFVGIANGGNAPSVNLDDGGLNYDTGVVANEFRFSGDLTLAWRNFGLFVRGFGFYDFETELDERGRTPLSDEALSLVGAGGKLQEYYLSASFAPLGLPIHLRVGNQIINWGSGSFLRFGTDIVNPVDFVSLLRPTASKRDVFVPQGMIWAASNVMELLAIEGFYQFEWEPVIDQPVGYFLSADDLDGGDGPNTYFTGAGEFSDLGTDLDQRFGQAPGTLGFDRDFMRVPWGGAVRPRSQGQFGFTAQLIVPKLDASSVSVHFVSYHSRLPLISAIAPDQDAIDLATAIGASNPTDDEKLLAMGRLSNAARYVITYPEDIRMLGLSFEGVLPYSGTLMGLEVSHHFDWPVQILTDSTIESALTPIRDALNGLPPGPIGAGDLISGIDETGKTQLAASFGQVFGPRLWSSQSLLAFDIGWVHFDDLAPSSEFDSDSWGYTITGAVSYDGVFGGVNLQPFVAFTHDVSGISPGPAGAFLEDRKSVSVGVEANWINTVTGSLTYVSFLDGKPLNAGVDRDFLSFSIRYYY
jgi:hypothetical protein